MILLLIWWLWKIFKCRLEEFKKDLQNMNRLETVCILNSEKIKPTKKNWIKNKLAALLHQSIPHLRSTMMTFIHSSSLLQKRSSLMSAWTFSIISDFHAMLRKIICAAKLSKRRWVLPRKILIHVSYLSLLSQEFLKLTSLLLSKF